MRPQRGSAPAAPPVRRGPAFLRVFRHRDYSLLTAGIMGTQLGSWIQAVAQGWLVYLITHSAFQLGLVGFIRGIVQIAVSPFAGAVADRVDRRLLLIAATALSAASGTVLALLVAFHSIHIWQIYCTGMLDGLAVSLNIPVRQAMIYDAVEPEELTTALAVTSLASNLTRILGPSLGGFLIGLAGLAATFFTQAGAYLADLGVTLFLRPAQRSAGRAAPFFASVREGLAYTARAPIVQRLTLLTIVPNLFVWPYVQFLPVFATKVLHVGPGGYGLLTTAVAYGSIAGGGCLALLSNVPRRGLLTIGTTFAYICCLLAFALMHSFVAAFAALAVAGIFNSIYITLNQTLLQENIDDAYRGRVLTLYATASSLYPFGGLAMGVLVSLLGAPVALASLSLAAIALVIAVSVASPQIRRL